MIKPVAFWPANLAFRMAGIPLTIATGISHGVLITGRIIQPHVLDFIDQQTGYAWVAPQSQSQSQGQNASSAAAIYNASNLTQWYVEN